MPTPLRKMQGRFDVLSTMQHADDLKAILLHSVEDQVVLEPANGPDADVLERRVVGFPATAQDRAFGDLLYRYIGGVKKT